MTNKALVVLGLALLLVAVPHPDALALEGLGLITHVMQSIILTYLGKSLLGLV